MTRHGFAEALPPYLGGKRRLCSTIFRELNRVLPRDEWTGLRFLDGFAGACSVSLGAKARGFDVTACDVAARSHVVAVALVENMHVTIGLHDIFRTLARAKSIHGPVSERFVPTVFSENVGRLLDALLVEANTSPVPAKTALLKLLLIRIAMAAHPMSSVRAGTNARAVEGKWESITPTCVAPFVDALRSDTPERLWTLARKINAGVIAGRGKAIQGDVLELLPTIKASILFADPPYSGTTSFESEYRVIDEILEGSARPVSAFSSPDGAALLDRLFERAGHIPIWVLSFGNATTSLEELEAKMARHGRIVRAKSIRYAHKSAQASKEKKAANREFLVIGVDPNTRLPVRLEGALKGVAV